MHCAAHAIVNLIIMNKNTTAKKKIQLFSSFPPPAPSHHPTIDGMRARLISRFLFDRKRRSL